MKRILPLWRRLENKPFGKWCFSRLVSHQAPYFKSIKPLVEELRAGHVRVSMQKRRAVHNHIGTVHAIAMCNLCELAAGLVTEVSIPDSMRWLPRGMMVEYLQKAQTNLVAECDFPAIEEGKSSDVPVNVEVRDAGKNLVCRAIITMYVSPRKAKAQ